MVTFNKVLSGTLHGDAFGEDRGLQMQRIQFDFRVVRVQGRVRFQYSGDPSAVLKLKRLTKKQILGELNLAEYACVSSPDEFTTVEFDFEPDVQNPFWQRGATGKDVSDFPSAWDLHFTFRCRDRKLITSPSTFKANRWVCTTSSARKAVSSHSTNCPSKSQSKKSAARLML